MNIWFNVAVVGLVVSGGGMFFSSFMGAINKYAIVQYKRKTRMIVLVASILVFLASYVLLHEIMGK